MATDKKTAKSTPPGKTKADAKTAAKTKDMINKPQGRFRKIISPQVAQ